MVYRPALTADGAMRLALALLALALAPAAASTGRESLSFNKAWRFHHGDPPSSPRVCPPAAFPTTHTDVTCDMVRLRKHPAVCLRSMWVHFDRPLVWSQASLTFAPLHNAEECRQACCSGLYLSAPCAQWMFLS